jgi:hypothetical protein
MDIAQENLKRIRQLEFVVNQLQNRIAQIAGSYELEIAVLKADLEEAKRLVDPEEVD